MSFRFFDIGGAKANEGKCHIGIPVKQDIVKGHVEVAIVIDPLALNGIGRAFNRGRKNHRNFLPIC